MLCLHRQVKCVEAEDVLCPYSSLDYTWDEPSLPHRILLALPGSRTLGVFALDEVRHMCHKEKGAWCPC